MSPALYAILVGIDQYQVSEIADLRTAVADVRAVERALRTRLAVDPNRTHVETLVTGGTGPAPTRNTIISTFNRMARAPMGPDDVFVFYFAGHGIEQAGEHFLLGSDSPFDRELRWLRSGALALEHVRDLCKLFNAGQQVIVLDACRNDPTTGGRSLAGGPAGAVVTRGLVFEDVDSGTPVRGHHVRRAWVSACGVGQQSFEHAAVGNSWFCHNLLATLADEAGPEVAVPLLVDRTAARMRDRAWRELDVAAGQSPVLVCDDDGDPVRLPLRPAGAVESVVAVPPAVAAPSPVDPVASVDWLGLVPTTAATPPTSATADVHRQAARDLVELDELDRRIAALRKGNHPSVEPAVRALFVMRNTAAFWRDRAADLRRDLTPAVAAQLEGREAIRPSELRQLVGAERTPLAVEFIGASHKSRDLAAELATATAAFEGRRDAVVGELQSLRDAAAARVDGYRRDDVRQAVARAVGQAPAAGFPLTALLREMPDLRRRHAGLSAEQILSIAEDAYVALHPAAPTTAPATAPTSNLPPPPRQWRDADVGRFRLPVGIVAAAGGRAGLYVVGRDAHMRHLPLPPSAPEAIGFWPVHEPAERVVVSGDVVLVQSTHATTCVSAPKVAIGVPPLKGYAVLCAAGDHGLIAAKGTAVTVHATDWYATPDAADWVGAGRRVSVHRGSVTAAAAAGGRFAAGGREGDVRWGPLAAADNQTPARPYEFAAWVTAVALSPDGERLAVVGKRNRVDVVRTADGTVAFRAPVAGRFLTAVTYFDHGQLLAVGDDAGTVTVLSADDGGMVWSGKVGTGGPSGGKCDVVAILADCGGVALAAVCGDGSVLTVAGREALS